MGNAPSGKNAASIEALIAQFTFISKKDDPRYGQISLYENKTTKEIVAFKEIVSKSTTDFKKEVEMLTARCADKRDEKTENPKSTGTSNIVNMLSFATQAHENLCSSFYRIAIVIEYIELDLQSEILAKKNAKEIYTEDQIWLIIESLVSALSGLHRKNIFLGDLKPINVLVSKDGVYKLGDPILMSSHSVSGYTRRLSKLDGSRPYLSPELLKNLEDQEFYPRHDVFRSDIFAAGLTILHAASLTDCEDFYNWENNTFSSNALKQRFNSVSDIYSEKLLEFMGKLVSYEQENRFNAFEAYEALEQIDWRSNSKTFRIIPTKTEEAEVIMEGHGNKQENQAQKVRKGVEEEGNVVEGKLHKNEILKNKVLQKEHPKSKDNQEIDFEEEEEKSKFEDKIPLESFVGLQAKPASLKKQQAEREKQKSVPESSQPIRIEESNEPLSNRNQQEDQINVEAPKDQPVKQQAEEINEQTVNAEKDQVQDLKSKKIKEIPISSVNTQEQQAAMPEINKLEEPRSSADPQELLNEYHNNYVKNAALTRDMGTPTELDYKNQQSKDTAKPSKYQPYSPISSKYSSSISQSANINPTNENAQNKASTQYSPVKTTYTPSTYTNASKYQPAKNESSLLGSTQPETVVAVKKSENETTKPPINKVSIDPITQEDKQSGKISPVENKSSLENKTSAEKKTNIEVISPADKKDGSLTL